MPLLPEPDLIDATLDRFQELTGLKATLKVPMEDRHRWGNLPCIKVNQEAQEWVFPVTCAANVDRVTVLNQIHHRIVGFPADGLLVVPYMTPEMGRKCTEMGLQFMDATGNTFLRQNGLYVLIAGHKPDRTRFRAERPTRAFDKTGLRLVFALLAEPDLETATYRELAKAAGVALGTVGHVLADLREQGLIAEPEKGRRRWIDRDRAEQAWVTNYPLRLRERLRVRRFEAQDPDWWRHAEPAAFEGCWGGEVAAAKLMGDLIPKTVTVYLPEDRNGFLAKYRLRAHPQGPIEVLDTFWTLPPAKDLPPGMVPPLLIYADLQMIGDPRTLEAARKLHDHYLA